MKTASIATGVYPEPRKISTRPGRTKAPALLTASGVDQAALDAVFGRGAATCADPKNAWILCELGTPLKGGAEAYRLEIGEEGVEIEAASRAGALHALRSLKQMIRAKGSSLPRVKIEDWPEFPVRGAMLDISRDRVPTMGSLFELVDKLAEMKLNHLQLYIEHTFAYAGHESVWRDASPMTSEEMRALDAYCAARGVELCANQNCLGHMERWLKKREYAHLGEMPTPYFADVWGGFYAEPNTLNPADPASLKLLKDLLTQIVPTCSGRFVNIGCDEPIDLGKGRSKALCEAKGRLTVYGEHVSKVADFVSDLGRRPQFWADPDFGNKRDEVPALPENLIGLVWGYEENLDFSPRVHSIGDAGYETWVAPGANGWNSYTGRTKVRRSNLANAAKTRKLGCVGFLNTEWGDNGHRQQWPLTLLGLAEGAYVSWKGEAPENAATAGLQLFGDAALGDWLEELGLADDHIRVGNQNASFSDMNHTFFNPAGPGDVKSWRLVKEKLAALEKTEPSGDGLVARELRHALTCAVFATDRALLRRSKNPSWEARSALTKRLVDICEEHKALWLARSRPGGLVDS